MNLKVVNQVGTRVKLKADRILPSAVLSSGEIFVYHQLLNETDRKAKITLKAVDEYTDKPLILNGESKLIVTPTTYDDTQEAYVSREGESRIVLSLVLESYVRGELELASVSKTFFLDFFWKSFIRMKNLPVTKLLQVL